MTKDITYTIFKTKWGYFGLAATENGLIRTVLPCPEQGRMVCKSPKITKKYLISGLNDPKFDKNLLKPLQNKIIAYFEGKSVRFFAPLAINELSPFLQKTLNACKKIPSGKTVTYSQLAAMVGQPKAGRAVGNALAKNPIPLIIPCHRVIRRDGSIGNFSAPGGSALKRKLLVLESKS